ncbi:unnamed protein product, partial [Rangifer tarandus platyrhynchus]
GEAAWNPVQCERARSLSRVRLRPRRLHTHLCPRLTCPPGVQLSCMDTSPALPSDHSA